MHYELIIVSTAYFAPVQWYQKLASSDLAMIERCESFAKQTYRNRAVIATTNGLQALTVPIERTDGDLHRTPISDIRISNHGNWRHLHWYALASAYGESPFFEYYADDLRPFFDREWKYLYDFNMAICRKMCELIDIHPRIEDTSEYVPADSLPAGASDFRETINPKHPLPDGDFVPREYYQVYKQKHGFLPNLSILDLLFNMGPESVFYLQPTKNA